MTGAVDASAHVRAVRRTDRRDRWRPVIDALGGQEVDRRPSERVFRLGCGDLVLRGRSRSERAGAENPVTAIEIGTEVGIARGRSTGRIVGPDGLSIAVLGCPGHRPAPDRPTVATGDRARARVCPLWMTADVHGAAAALRSAGLTVRLAAQSGNWVDLLAPGGGLIAIHADSGDRVSPPHAVLAFEAGDIDALARRFRERGVSTTVIDESYGRSLRFADPDGGGEIWVNETMTDFYGYRVGAP